MLSKPYLCVVAGAALLFGGCAVDDPIVSEAEQTAEVVKPGHIEEGVIAPTERYRSALPVIAPQPLVAAPVLAGFTWTETPGPQHVPEQTVTGRIQGREFRCRYVSVRPDEEDGLPTYLLRFSDKPRGKQCAFSFDDNSVCVEWSTPHGVGEWSKSLDQARREGSYAWYTLRQADGTPLTRNPEWACYLRIEEERGPTEAGGVSSLQGRIALVFGDDTKSWLAGTFVADGCK